MELLDRYVQKVKFWLPRAQRDDIVAELSDDIHSQIAEEEAKLGRPLNDDEVASVLKRCGNPLLVANRYLPQQYLIGPLLFPVYRFVLTIVVLCYLVPWLLVWIGFMSFDASYRSAHSVGEDLFGGLGSFWFIALLAVGVVTIVFAVLERIQSRSRFLEDWDPRKLPSVRDPIQIPRFNSILELGANLVFILWLVTSIWPQIILARTGVRITLGPVWRGLFWALLSVALANIALAAVNLFRPYWTWLRGSVRLAFDSAGAVAVCWLFRANILAEISAPHLSPARAVETTNAINSYIAKSFPFAVLACVAFVALPGARRLVRLRAGRTQLVQGLALVAALAIIATSARAQGSLANRAFSLPSDTEIHELLVDHVAVQHKSVGTVVGIISPQGRRIISYGHLNQGDPRPLDGDTVFETGSITKIFTALLLADMAQRGEVALTDPLAKYLPPTVKIPQRSGRQITLADLATHTSGLPFFPSDFPGDSDPENLPKHMAAAAMYSDEQLYQFLSAYQLRNDPGSHWAYSNLGVGLLGIALAHRAGMDYEALVHERITGPLGMTSTAISISPQMRNRLGTGHNAELQPVPDWTMPIFAGAGSLRSTANDLLTLLAAFMDYTKSPLQPAMTAMLQTQRPGPNLTQGLGWWVISFGPGDDGIVTSAGETLGYASVIAYDPKTRVGVVVLSNSALNDGGLAWHLLHPAFPVATSTAAKALSERKEVVLDARLLDRYVGQYQPARGETITVERQGDVLILKSEAAPQGLRLHAQSEQAFFIREADAIVTFKFGARGPATEIVVHFAGTDTLALRTNSGSEKN